jgi:hypothetical protein
VWIKTKKGRLINLDNAFDVYANDPRSEVGGRVFGCWTVVARGAQLVGVLATCDSQEEAEAICEQVWQALRQKADHLDLSASAGRATAARAA